MYEQSGLTYDLNSFGVVPIEEPDFEDIEREAIPEGLIASLKEVDSVLYNRFFSLETLLKVKFVPLAGDGSIDRSENDFIVVLGLLKHGISKEVCMSFLLHPTLECGRKSREHAKPWYYANTTVNAALRRMKRADDLAIHAFGPDGKFSTQIAAHSIVDKHYITWFRGRQWSYTDSYYQPGSRAAEYLALEGRLMFSLHPKQLSDTRALIEEIAMTNPSTLTESANWLAVKNGLVNLHDGSLVPSTPKYFTPGRIPVVYNDSVPKEVYAKLHDYVIKVVGEENEPLIWSQLGMCLTTDSRIIRIPVALILYGRHDTGKSELLRLITAFLGEENVSAVDISSLASDKDYYTWNLMGKRANITHEAPPEMSLFNTARLKLLISGDDTELREIMKAPVASNNYARFWLAINHEIRSKVDSALYKRLRILTTTHEFDKDPNEKPGYSRQLAEDPLVLSGMLNLALKHLFMLRKSGEFPQTEATQRATNEQRESNDSVEEFIVECSVDAPGHSEVTADFYSAYEQYCEKSRKGSPMGRKKFKKHLEEITSDRTDIKLVYEEAKWVPEKKNTYTVWTGRKLLTTTFSVSGANGKTEIKLVKSKEA